MAMAAMLFHNGTRFLALMESSRTSKTSLFLCRRKIIFGAKKCRRYVIIFTH